MADGFSLLSPDQLNVTNGLLPSMAPRSPGLLDMAPQPPQMAPQAPSQQSAAYPDPTPTRGPVNPVLAGLDNLLFNGAFQKGSQAHYEQLVNNAQIKRQYAAMVDYAKSLPDQERSLFWNDPQGYIKQQQGNEAQQVVAGGSTLVGHRDAMSGYGGPYTAPLIGHDEKSGGGYSVNGAGVQSTGGTANGGDFINGPGNSVISGRTGQLQGTVTPPQNYPATDSHDPMQITGFGASGAPQVSGGPPLGAPMLGASTAGPSAPRGIRNNNYTNLTALPGGQKWNGQTGVDKGGYVQFDTPQSGMAAAAKNLNAYATKHGINTVAGLVGRWAPSGAGNNTAAYTKFVAQRLGVSPTAQIDLTDPATAQKALGAIAAFENGPKAFPASSGAPPPMIGAPTAPGPASAPGSFPPGHVQGKTAQPMSADEIRTMGLAPGRYQREPDGKVTTIAAAPKTDVARVDSLNATVQGLRALQQEQQMFMHNNEKAGTGARNTPIEVGHHNINPFETIGKQNPNFNSMVASEGKQLFMVKPANAGARILQSELPYWETQTQGVEKPPEVNAERLKTTTENLNKAQAQAKFYSDWVYSKGNLDGADAAWDRSQGARPTASATPAPLPTYTFEQAQKAPPGTRFRDPSGTVRVKH